MNATMAPPVKASPVSTADLARIRSEFVEMPGLVLTLPQAARLWGVGTQRAAELLSALLNAGFLVCDKKTLYRRRR